MVGSTFKEAYKGLTGDADQYSPDELAEIAAFLNGKRFGKRAIVQDGLTLADSAVAQLGNVEKMPSVRRTGKFIAEGPESVGTGILAGLIHVGARPALVSSSVEGDCNAYSTSGASSGQTTGLRLVIPNIFRMRRNLRLKIKFSISAVNMTADPRLYIGFDSVASWPISDVPLGNSDSGVVFGKSAGDTVFKIYNNDATGAEIKGNAKGGTVDAPNDINVATDVHVLEFKSDADGLRWLYNIDGGEDMELTMRIPALDTQLYFRALVQNATSTVVVLNVYYVEAEILAEGYLNDILPWTGSGGSDRGIWKNDKIETVFNKIIPVDLNTLRDSDDVLNNPGDILVNDNTRYARFAKGTALQYLRVKADGTGLEWATLAGTSTADVFTNQANVFGDFDNKFRSGRLRIANPANNKWFSLVASAIAADVNISLPPITTDDEIVTKNLIGQILSNKMLTSATITDILTFARQTVTPAVPSVGYAQIYPKIKDTDNDGFFAQVRIAGTVQEVELTASLASTSFAKLDAANTYGDFDQKIRSGRLKLMNPANTFGYKYVGDAITAERQILLPPLTADDTPVFQNFTQPITNKTIVASSNNFQGVMQNPTVKRSGWAMPMVTNSTTAASIIQLGGALANHTPTGAGTNAIFQTPPGDTGLVAGFVSSATGQNMGLVSPATTLGFCKTYYSGYLRTNAKAPTTNGRRWFGIIGVSTIPISDTPMASAVPGILVGWGTGDTYVTVYHNDASGTVVKDVVTGNLAKDESLFHTIEISWPSGGTPITVKWDSVVMTFSADIPANTANLWFFDVGQSVSTTIALYTHGTWVEFGG